MVTPEQIRAARALLGWSQAELATKADVPISAIKSFETGRDTRVSILTKIETAFVDAGVMFLEPGDARSGGRGLRFRQ